MDIFDVTVQRAADPERGGFLEAFSRDWAPVPNTLMGRDDAAKTFNAHFHLLEALDGLLAVAPDRALRAHAQSLFDRLIGPALNRADKTFLQFFDAEWRPLDAGGSNGHDIEASWLLPAIAGRIGADGDASDGVAQAVLARAVDADGGVVAGCDASGHHDRGKLWWVQAEAMVGLDAFERSGDPLFLDAVERLWAFIKDVIVDPEAGEWRERIEPAGDHRAGSWRAAHLWKCPYHNGRACLEVSKRAARLARDKTG